MCRGAFWTLDFVFKSTKSCITFSHYTYMISQKTVINKLYFQNLWQFIIKNNWTLEITSSIVICFSLVQDIFMVEGECDQGAATKNSLLPITSFLKLNWCSERDHGGVPHTYRNISFKQQVKNVMNQNVYQKKFLAYSFTEHSLGIISALWNGKSRELAFTFTFKVLWH